MRTLFATFLSVLVLAVVCATPRAAVAGGGDADQRMSTLMRVLNYDKKLDARKDGGAVFIAVVFRPDNKSSGAEKDAVIAALGRLESVKVKGSPISYAAFPYSNESSLKSALGGRRAAAMYVCGGLDDAIGDIRRFASQAKIATMSGSEPLTQAGLAFAAVDKGGKNQIIVNLVSAKDQGLDLEASLLGIATVLRDAPAIPAASKSGSAAGSTDAAGAVFQTTDEAMKRRISGGEPKYPERARIQSWEATLTARVFISAKGAVEKLEFVQTDEHFEETVKKTVKTWKFKPYLVNGQPVSSYTVMKFVFKLH